MTVADLLFYDVPGFDWVRVQIEKHGDEYHARVPGGFVLVDGDLVSSLTAIRRYLAGEVGMRLPKPNGTVSL